MLSVFSSIPEFLPFQCPIFLRPNAIRIILIFLIISILTIVNLLDRTSSNRFRKLRLFNDRLSAPLRTVAHVPHRGWLWAPGRYSEYTISDYLVCIGKCLLPWQSHRVCSNRHAPTNTQWFWFGFHSRNRSLSSNFDTVQSQKICIHIIEKCDISFNSINNMFNLMNWIK